ncbi:hypothetical protein MTsPCn9_05810 [Croceitalea sp. MTPC9]|uniref:ATP-grasp domain-containing protein n=1 Tax=unclassified Croceitalea TaxID=2632280 RepID=UPI002B3C15E1|nr:hypothetical protein MTsPCn6_02900 [Croceitalea sp. MTPC6]GMN15645.1 hypothetical protein MTsPCn9_05810 [Croceitalea sp. MTPC9]
MRYDITILTDSRYINPTKTNKYIENVLLEDQMLQDELVQQGLSVTRKPWDDKNFDWSSSTYAIFRATWDYFDRYEEFFEWFQKTAQQTTFINSKTLIRWNIDKHYLQDLNKKGVNIPKTLFVEPNTKTSLADSIKNAKSTMGFTARDFVLKPCIGGGAYHTYKFHESDCNKHEATFKELICNQAMMLQEFQKNIVVEGEISMMVLNGKFTHAVLKIAKPGDFRVQDDYGGSVHKYQPSSEEIDFAISIVNAAPELPIYARVDIFKDNEEKLALAELEVFEPELWFRFYPKAAQVLAKSIKEGLF